jgi:protein-tyrosine-phosphatase
MPARRMAYPLVMRTFLVLLSALFTCSPARAQTAGLDTALIETLTGAKGALDPKEGVFKVSVPRTDLAVTAAGVRITPPMGLTSWAAFKRAGEHTVVMGDLVLLEDQVNPVMSTALDEGLEVTALHNHFFWDTPKVMFMHIGGTADEAKLATAVGRVFAKIADTAGGKGSVPRAEIDPARTTLDPQKIAAVLGTQGTLAAGVYKVVIGRTARMHGHEMGAAMGVNTWAAFAGTDERAVVDGDFAMRESELQGVLKALRGAGIDVVAIHHHMTGEEPRIVFLHYWGVGRTEELARGLRRALDETKHDQRASADTVVFVCEHGSVKSLMAQEWFNRLARERGVSLRAVSRGTAPDSSVPAAVSDYLRGEGFDVSGFQPAALASGDLDGAVRVVALGADTSSVTAGAHVPVEGWNDIPPARGEYKRTSDAIRARVEALLSTLSGDPASRSK